MTKSNVPAFALISGAKGINKAITSIQIRGARLDRDIQIAALSAMQHHVEHGDVSLINRLIDAMPKGSRVKKLVAFIGAFGAVTYDWESKSFRHMKNGTFKLDEAQAVLWSDYEPPALVADDEATETTSENAAPAKINANEKPYKGIKSDTKLVNELIDRMEKDKRVLGEKSNVSDELLAGLCALVNRGPALVVDNTAPETEEAEKAA